MESKYQCDALWAESEVKWETKLSIKNQEESEMQGEKASWMSWWS